ncbi:MAG: TonB-dependent receptor [Acidobacteria bacterium]|jgi:iron complex outermembrane receptor protein|nr:TonB-dependent receptor [Acidobacteriota bacterium]
MNNLCKLKQNTFFMLLMTTLFFTLFFIVPINGENENTNDPGKKKEEQPRIIEVVEVTATEPSQQPLSTVSLLPSIDLERILPKNLAEVFNQVPGTYVTDGGKGESSLMIRGLASNRITLMYDGIPIYEPYFNTFDLKSLPAAGIESIQVIKGTSSILYGPNTLGGIVNIVSKRIDSPFVQLDARLGENSTNYISGAGGYNWEKLSILGNITWDKSDGFKWKNNDGDRILRKNSNYERKNFAGKVMYNPTGKSEIMAEIMYYTADYGIPAATAVSKARYWNFKDWDRLQFNAGALFPIFNDGILKFRTYYVNHHNVLDAYNDEAFTQFQWESIYKNNTFGSSLMGEIPLSPNNMLKFGTHYSHYNIRQQSTSTSPWEKYKRDILSLGIEDHWNLNAQWKIVGGASLDTLKNNEGKFKTTVNPILGIRFSPNYWFSIHTSMAFKSRFPSMNSLYSSSNGNPNLLDEKGKIYEIGLDYYKFIEINASIFYSTYKDMIQAYRGLDGYKSYQNVGQAEIYGVELSSHKKLGIFNITLNYTYMESKEKEINQPLDYTPKSQFNGLITIGPVKGFALDLWGMAVSKSQVKMGKNPPFQYYEIPAYALIHTRLAKTIGNFTVYARVENLLNKAYYSEPGFPMKARTFSIGFQWDQHFHNKLTE